MEVKRDDNGVYDLRGMRPPEKKRLKLLDRMDISWSDLMSFIGFAVMVIALGALAVVAAVWWIKQIVDWS